MTRLTGNKSEETPIISYQLPAWSKQFALNQNEYFAVSLCYYWQGFDNVKCMKVDTLLEHNGASKTPVPINVDHCAQTYFGHNILQVLNQLNNVVQYEECYIYVCSIQLHLV